MGNEEFERTELLLGEAAVARLNRASVTVFGIGGVGSYAAEALARAGIGRLLLVDPDCVARSNINRQLIALHSTIGRNKAEVMRERILDINPEADVLAMPVFYDAQSADQFPLAECDYIVDAIDTVSSKLLLIERAAALSIPIVRSMGAGNRLDPTAFEVADIFETSVCPLARIMRRELKKRGIRALRVVFSREESKTPVAADSVLKQSRRLPIGSVSFVPSAAGLILAGEVIRALSKNE